ncbi:MAG: putative metal-binding motif-containing protein [Deltaproteobacteria bacterium]|nr:putative metal-binding motif-containing protein [Deltaproteobacteria bacterium]
MCYRFSLPLAALALLMVFNGCEPDRDKTFKASLDHDGDGYTMAGSNPDCDDDDPDVFPDAEELCDGIDNDCDGEEDEGLPLWYPDSDGDNFGDEGDAGLCDPPSATGWTPDNTDCDDLEPDEFPGAPELCDGIDNDCDPMTPMDEDVSASDGAIEAWPDEDDDGEGAMDGAMILVCDLPDDYAANAKDCDDLDSGVNTAAEEWCDGLDNDCDAETDEDAVDATAWCVDGDGDAYTAEDCVPRLACDAAMDEIEQSSEFDWDDTNSSVYPGAEEFCDGLDNDQNGLVDDDATDADEWWPDLDGDGAGDEDSIGVLSCETLLDMVTNEEDCDDWEALSHSGHTELCGDGIDNDCNDEIDTDCPDNYADYGVASEWFAGDVDGDGAEDVILYLCGDTEPTATMEFEEEPEGCDPDGVDVTDSDNDVCWLVALSDGSSFEAYNVWANTLGREADQRFVLDVDGDSMVDLVWVQDSDGDGYGEWHVALADLSTWTFREQPGPWMVDSVAFTTPRCGSWEM